MSEVKRFNLKDYKSGNYNVQTLHGGNVEIVAVDEARDTIFGFYSDGRENTPTNWNLDGSFFSVGNPDSRDLYLRPKRVTVHVNITRSRSGVIGCAINTDRQPKLYSGTSLVKYITVELED